VVEFPLTRRFLSGITLAQAGMTAEHHETVSQIRQTP